MNAPTALTKFFDGGSSLSSQRLSGLSVKRPSEDGFVRILDGGYDVLCNLLDKLVTPKWVAYIIVDDSDVLEIERHVVTIGRTSTTGFCRACASPSS